MAIQECYYFNGIWVHWDYVQLLQIILSLSDILIYLYCWRLISVTRSWYFLCKKDTKIKKRWNILKKMNSLKKGEGVPLLNFEGGPGVPLLNFEGDPGVPLLNFRGVPGPTFKHWGGSWVPGSWSHFYTMPLICRIYLKKYIEFITAKCESTFTCSSNCLS